MFFCVRALFAAVRSSAPLDLSRLQLADCESAAATSWCGESTGRCPPALLRPLVFDDAGKLALPYSLGTYEFVTVSSRHGLPPRASQGLAGVVENVEVGGEGRMRVQGRVGLLIARFR